MAGVCWARAVTLPHRGAIGALCTLGWRFYHCNQWRRLTAIGLNEVLELEIWTHQTPTLNKIPYTYFYPSAERFADISWRFSLTRMSLVRYINHFEG